MKLVIAIYLVLINVITFIVYGVDKSLAIKHKWRISEATLIILAAIGGSIGAFLGMQIFRHKTKHIKFVLGVPVIFILQVVAAFLLLRGL